MTPEELRTKLETEVTELEDLARNFSSRVDDLSNEALHDRTAELEQLHDKLTNARLEIQRLIEDIETYA